MPIGLIDLWGCYVWNEISTWREGYMLVNGNTAVCVGRCTVIGYAARYYFN